MDGRDHPAAGSDDPDAQAIYGAIAGHIAAGRYVLAIGDPCGALVRDASRGEPPHVRPRPTPILLRPKSIRGLLDRQELAAALSALDAGLPLEITGEPGIGKTAFLRQLAHHPRAASYADGIVYLSARHQSATDLLQLIFEAFYELDGICKPTEAEIRRGLAQKKALILLDDLHLAQDELERVFDAAPSAAFVIATRARCLWGEGHSIPLKGLPADQAVLLLERAIERPLEATERSAVEHLCASLAGHPLRILQAAALARERAIPVEGWARDVSPESLLTALLSSIDEKQRRVLLALTALGGVPLPVQEVSGIAEVTDIEASLTVLVRRGLVVVSHARYLLADGVADRLRRREDLKPWVNRAVTYFTAWAERHHRSASTLLLESEALVRTQQCAAEARRWGEAFRLGRILEGALALGSRWGAWAIVLDRCLAAAKATGDRAAEAWALHQKGTRALCAGEPDIARGNLGQALKLREGLADAAAAAATRGNLGFVIVPVPVSKLTPPSPLGLELETLQLRDDVVSSVRVPTHTRFGPMLIAIPLLASLGWFGGWAFDAARSGRSPADRSLQGRPAALPFEEPRPIGSSAVLETAVDVAPLTPAPSAGRKRELQHPHFHGAPRTALDKPIDTALLRGERCVPGAHRAWHWRRQPVEHAELSSGRAAAHHDLRAHRVRPRRPAGQTAGRRLRQVRLARRTSSSSAYTSYRFKTVPFMPLEFAGAMYRLDHSMVRGHRVHKGHDLPSCPLRVPLHTSGIPSLGVRPSNRQYS